MEFNRAQLKRSVKRSMKNTVPNPMLVALLFTVVVSAGSGLINTVLGRLLTGGSVGSFSELYLHFLQRGYEVEEAMEQAMLVFLSQGPGNIFAAVVGGAVLSVLVALWRSTMNVGYEGWCLSMVRDEHPPMGKIFGALPRFGQVLITRFLTGLFEALWALLLCAGYVIVLVAAALLDVPVLSILLVAAGFLALALGAVWVTMRYALVDFVLLDEDLSGMDAVRESKRLMKGRTKDAFFLQFSFIGWYLLECAIVIGALLIGVAAFGGPFLIDYINAEMFAASVMGFLAIMIAAAVAAAILNLWLQPYVTGAMAAFYDWARGAADGFGGADGGWGGPSGYTWSAGPSSGTGMGSGNGGSAPRSPRPPRDDPWN